VGARIIDVADGFEANEVFGRNGWTDGLPIVPPTPELVAAALDAALLEPDQILGVEPVRSLAITAEKVAVNAVMAGCRPADLAVVAAVIEAMCEPAYLLHGSAASTGGSAPVVIVNGPIRTTLGLNTGANALGGGGPNAVIGRAVRLVLINLLGCVPGVLDQSTLGQPGKMSFCLAEDEDAGPWRPLAQERGVPDGASAVTVLACAPPRQVMNEWTTVPEEICDTFAAEIRANMCGYSIWPGNYVLVIPPQLRSILVAAGWRKADVREHVWRRARVTRRQWREWGKGGLAGRGDPDQEFAALESPDDLLVVAAGGAAGGFAAVIPPWLGNRARAVTKGIGVCLDCDPGEERGP
jgi:hypothetical protein